MRDARRMTAGFSGGLGVHRVCFYGNYLDGLEKLSRMPAFELVAEG